MAQVEQAVAVERPKYQAPSIRVMSEQEILNSFQITQSMAMWWATGMC